jgi:hypothetical protein
MKRYNIQKEAENKVRVAMLNTTPFKQGMTPPVAISEVCVFPPLPLSLHPSNRTLHHSLPSSLPPLQSDPHPFPTLAPPDAPAMAGDSLRSGLGHVVGILPPPAEHQSEGSTSHAGQRIPQHDEVARPASQRRAVVCEPRQGWPRLVCERGKSRSAGRRPREQRDQAHQDIIAFTRRSRKRRRISISRGWIASIIHIYTYIYIFVHSWFWAISPKRPFVCFFVSLSVSLCLSVSVYVFVFLCVCVCERERECVCVCVCMCMHFRNGKHCDRFGKCAGLLTNPTLFHASHP